MLNVYRAGKDPYLSAPPPKPKSFFEQIELYVVVFFDLVKVILIGLARIIAFPVTVWFREGPKSIKGKNALITGGANGIGKAIALELAKFGCNVIITDIDEQASEKTLKLLRKCDVKSIAYSADVSNPMEVETLKEAIEESLGPIDILINNAGLIPLASLREGDSSGMKRLVDVNLNANIWTIRTFLPGMLKRQSGHIVQISSMSALHPMPGAIVYTATKFAVAGLILALEEELRQEGNGDCIDFTTVYPYFVSTRLDLMNILNLRFPAITPQFTAKEIVKGIIQKKRRIIIPQFNALLSAFLSSLPYNLQCLARDYILREPESRVIKDPFVYVS